MNTKQDTIVAQLSALLARDAPLPAEDAGLLRRVCQAAAAGRPSLGSTGVRSVWSVQLEHEADERAAGGVLAFLQERGITVTGPRGRARTLSGSTPVLGGLVGHAASVDAEGSEALNRLMLSPGSLVLEKFRRDVIESLAKKLSPRFPALQILDLPPMGAMLDIRGRSGFIVAPMAQPLSCDVCGLEFDLLGQCVRRGGKRLDLDEPEWGLLLRLAEYGPRPFWLLEAEWPDARQLLPDLASKLDVSLGGVTLARDNHDTWSLDVEGAEPGPAPSWLIDLDPQVGWFEVWPLSGLISRWHLGTRVPLHTMRAFCEVLMNHGDWVSVDDVAARIGSDFDEALHALERMPEQALLAPVEIEIHAGFVRLRLRSVGGRE